MFTVLKMFNALYLEGKALREATAAGSCLPLLLAACQKCPHLYVDVFTCIITEVSSLSFYTVEYVGTEWSRLSLVGFIHYVFPVCNWLQ